MYPSPTPSLVETATVNAILDGVRIPVEHRDVRCLKHRLVDVLVEEKAEE